MEYSKNRLGAVQFLFSLNFQENFDENNLTVFCQNEKLNLSEVKVLVQGTLTNQPEIDKIAKINLNNVPSWDKMDSVLKSILRIAIFELNFGAITKKIIISEYNKIAASFFGDSEAGLVTAILNKVVSAP